LLQTKRIARSNFYGLIRSFRFSLLQQRTTASSLLSKLFSRQDGRPCYLHSYTAQHAFARLLLKPAEITGTNRDPDSLLAMLALFRDVELDGGLTDEAVTREQTCAEFYLVDDEEEIKNAAIHLSAALTAIATNAQAGYQPSDTHGTQLRASILFRASIVYRFALATQGAEIVSAKRAFHNSNTTDR
jgi:hypothetical protein